jgi:predicted nucleic acid-binding protein
MSDSPTFIDTNVLVYAYDSDAGDKHQTAKLLVTELWQNRRGLISTQVLQEFYVTVTHKLPKPLSKQQAREVVQTYAAWSVYRPTSGDVVAASALEEHHKLSFWDAMIVVAAQMSGATKLLSEDMQHGRRLGQVTINNPFA